jgi:hypothetical protein
LKRAAVSGINCISPRASLTERASRLKFDSTAMIDSARRGSMP